MNKFNLTPIGIRPLILLAACASATAHAGDWADFILLGDSDSGINAGLSYTSLADFNGGATTINGVNFTDTGTSGTNYSMGGNFNGFTGYGNTLTGNLNGTSTNFFHTGDGSGNASLTLSGLTVGVDYVTSWYNASFGGKRFVTITPSDAATPITINQDANVSGAGNVLRYAFTATATTQTYSFDAVSDGDSFHHYTFTNAARNDSVFSYTHFAPVTPTVTEVVGQDNPFLVSNTDLLQTNLSGLVTTGNFNAEPTLGATSVLANGAMLIGVGANRPEMVTGSNNATATFTLDTSVNTLGYDVTSIAGYGGWGDGGRDEQRYNVFVSLVGSSDFLLYGQLSHQPAGGTLSGVSAVFTGSLSGVDEVKIVFNEGQENGFAGYGEFDVFGTATIPEPTAPAMILLGSIGLLTLRRRRQ